MADDQKERGELTERFQAFAQSVDPAPTSRALPVALIVGGVVLLVALVAAIVLLLAG